jgi:hypothetical protein
VRVEASSNNRVNSMNGSLNFRFNMPISLDGEPFGVTYCGLRLYIRGAGNIDAEL